MTKDTQGAVRYITARRARGRIRALPQHGLVYLNNNKSACTFIKTALWTAVSPQTFAGDPHTMEGAPFIRSGQAMRAHLDAILAADWFTAVRNPFARALSGYLDRVSGANPKAKRDFARLYGVPTDGLSFRDFLERLARDPVPEARDAHFSCQVDNVLHGLAPNLTVFHLENIAPLAPWLADRGVSLPAATNARTADAKLSTAYGPAEIDLVRQLYAPDFEAFGYSRDPSTLAPHGPLAVSPGNADGLANLLRTLPIFAPKVRSTACAALTDLLDADSLFAAQASIGPPVLTAAAVARFIARVHAGETRNWEAITLCAVALLKERRFGEAYPLLRIADAYWSGDAPLLNKV